MKTFKEYIREHEDAWEKDSAGNAVGWKAKEYQREKRKYGNKETNVDKFIKPDAVVRNMLGLLKQHLK
jgi:hypothetical protein